MIDRKPELFRGLDSPEPPADLHEKTMRAAVNALTRPAPPDIWTRVWQNRGLRMAWACSVALLAIGHVVVTPRGDGSPTVAAKPTARPPIETNNDELTAIARLPRIDMEVRGLRLGGDAHQPAGRGTDTVEPVVHDREGSAS